MEILIKQNSYSFWQKFLPPILLSIITFLFYYPSLWYPFMWDDLPTITKNIHVIWGSKNLFNEFYANNRWISNFLNQFNYKYWQTNTFSFRLINLIIHISIGILIFFLILKLFSSLKQSNFLSENAYIISILASGLFLLHPTQTQTATYINQMRLEGTVVFFTIAILLTFTYAANTTNIYLKMFLYSLTLILSSFAAGTKEIIIVFPFLVLLVDWFFVAQGNWKNLIKRILVHALICLSLFGTFAKWSWKPPQPKQITQMAVPNNRGNILTSTPEEKITPKPFMISQFKIILHYLTIYFWPFNLSFDYEYKLSTSIWNMDVIFPFLTLLLILLFAIFLFIKNKTNFISFCVAWFFISILPRASVIPATELVCDYKTYLASFGVLLFIAVLFTYLIKKLIIFISNFSKTKYQPRYQLALLTLIILSFAYSTKTRNLVWSSELAFWEDVIKKAPTKARAYNNLAVALAESGRVSDSMETYKKAMQCDPTYAEPVINIAIQYQSQGKNDIALQYYEKALTLKEGHPEMFLNLGVLHFQQQEYERAEKYFKVAISLKSYYSKAHFNLARTYHMQNKLEQALPCYEKALEGDYQDIEFFYLHGAVANNLGKHDKAISSLEKVKQINSNHKNTVFLLASSYYSLRQYQKASENFKILYEKERSNFCAYNYGQTLLNLNKFEQALSLFEQCKNDQNLPFSTLHIAKCLASIGQKDNAKKELQNLLKNSSFENIKQDAQNLLNELI